MNIDDCLAQGLLKKIKPDREKALRSLEVAESKAKKAYTLLRLDIFDMSLVNSYSSMFHSARALLFNDGFKERSHFALYVYIKEKYKTKIEPRFLNELNVLRLERHGIFYELETEEKSKPEAENALRVAQEFRTVMSKLLHELR